MHSSNYVQHESEYESTTLWIRLLFFIQTMSSGSVSNESVPLSHSVHFPTASCIFTGPGRIFSYDL